MNDCFVTRLKGVVDNDNLEKFGEVTVDIIATETIGVYGNSEAPVHLKNKSGFFVNKTTEEQTKTVDVYDSDCGYRIPEQSTIIIENPEDVRYIETYTSLLNNPLKIGYFVNNRSWRLSSMDVHYKLSYSFNDIIDKLFGMLPISRLGIVNYDFSDYNMKAVINHPNFNTQLANAVDINFSKNLLNIDVADVAEFNAITEFELFNNHVYGTIESFVAAMRIKRPNVNTFTFKFSCIDDRDLFTATFNGQNITAFENTYWGDHVVSWTANTITFMGTTINA